MQAVRSSGRGSSGHGQSKVRLCHAIAWRTILAMAIYAVTAALLCRHPGACAPLAVHRGLAPVAGPGRIPLTVPEAGCGWVRSVMGYSWVVVSWSR